MSIGATSFHGTHLASERVPSQVSQIRHFTSRLSQMITAAGRLVAQAVSSNLVFWNDATVVPNARRADT
jgi:hypothetical protein